MLRDTQDVKPLCSCGDCGNEIYINDLVSAIDGNLIHAEYMTPEQISVYPTYPAYTFMGRLIHDDRNPRTMA